MQAPLDLVLGREQGFFFFQVCKGRVGWGGARSSTRGLGEIWLQVRNESKRKFGTLIILFWQCAKTYSLNLAISEHNSSKI
jgi:hypothetical protein